MRGQNAFGQIFEIDLVNDPDPRMTLEMNIRVSPDAKTQHSTMDVKSKMVRAERKADGDERKGIAVTFR